VAQDHGAKRCDPDLFRTARSVEHGPTDCQLERGDVLTDGRLRVTEPGRRTPEGLLIGDRGQRCQVSELYAAHPRDDKPMRSNRSKIIAFLNACADLA
jgi:hypothetical protein